MFRSGGKTARSRMASVLAGERRQNGSASAGARMRLFHDPDKPGSITNDINSPLHDEN
jgi:hypothetical protein